MYIYLSTQTASTVRVVILDTGRVTVMSHRGTIGCNIEKGFSGQKSSVGYDNNISRSGQKNSIFKKGSVSCSTCREKKTEVRP